MSSYSFVSKDSIEYLNIEITTRCSVKCPMCPRTVFPQFLNSKLDMPVSLVNHLNFSDNLKKIYLTGANGDPIQHPNFHSFLRALKNTTKAQLNINTHGSFRSKNWWENTLNILSKTDHIIFSIDGLEDTNSIYRVHAHWRSIESAVKLSAQKLQTTWKFIIFKHNEHQISKAIHLAKSWGVAYFSLKRSDRWSEPYWPKDNVSDWMEHLRPSEDFVTKDYKDVEGPYSLKRKFNSVFNINLRTDSLPLYMQQMKVGETQVGN
ncbi:MAG: radical SAM protein [Oligoflexia bacterium]|nr:radical SAM protein [Oligoflexia bacterium]